MVRGMPTAARAKMSARFLVLAAAGLAAVGLSACDSSSGPTGSADKGTRQVTVVGAGQVQGTPDTLTVNASIEFVAPDVSSAMNQTSDRQRAVIDAKDRAQQYAQLASLKLGKVISITESGGSTPPTPMPSFKGAEVAAVPLEPGQQTVAFSVTVIFELT